MDYPPPVDHVYKRLMHENVLEEDSNDTREEGQNGVRGEGTQQEDKLKGK